jgi:hypothetical protein
MSSRRHADGDIVDDRIIHRCEQDASPKYRDTKSRVKDPAFWFVRSEESHLENARSRPFRE